MVRRWALRSPKRADATTWVGSVVERCYYPYSYEICCAFLRGLLVTRVYIQIVVCFTLHPPPAHRTAFTPRRIDTTIPTYLLPKPPPSYPNLHTTPHHTQRHHDGTINQHTPSPRLPRRNLPRHTLVLQQAVRPRHATHLHPRRRTTPEPPANRRHRTDVPATKPARHRMGPAAERRERGSDDGACVEWAGTRHRTSQTPT
jgi:hypothetical protein